MGLDAELFEGDVSEEFICGLCSQVLLNPVTAGCSHIFCQSCVTRKLNSRVSKSICPACSTQLKHETSETSVELKLKLLSLRMQCNHKCGEVFVLGDLPDHMEICPNAPVNCEFIKAGCRKTVKRCDLRKHLEECDFRDVECEACGFRTIYRELFTHQSKVRCLEKKLKQQIIRERKAAAQEINRHRDRLFRENVRLDQQQRKVVLSHSKSLNMRKQSRSQSKMDKIDPDSDFDYSPRDRIFITDSVIPQDIVNLPNRNDRDYSHVTRTPHSSRSGFVLNVCSQCNRKFRADTNHQASCRWHAGTCFACGRLDYQPGCATGFHRL